MPKADHGWARVPWTERRWTFGTPVEWFPEVVERLGGAPARADGKCRGLSDAVLSWRPAPESWSIKENIGHLVDLEPLLDGRIDDFLEGRTALRPADMSNRATHEARHNERPIESILESFVSRRAALVARLRGLEPNDFGRTAEHPRLRTPMRLIDAVTFACDHDDYHLARVDALIEMQGGG